MVDDHSPSRARKRTCLSGSKGFAAERHHRSREAALLLNSTSTSPEPAMPAPLPSAKMAKDYLPPRQEHGVLLDANEEENEYPCLGMMGTGGKTSKQNYLNPGQGIMNSGRDMMHPYIVPAAETAAEDDLRDVLCRAPPPRSFRTTHEQQEAAATPKPWDAISPSSNSDSNTMSKQRGTECSADAQTKLRHPYSFEISKLSDFSLALKAFAFPKPTYKLVRSSVSVAREHIDSPRSEGYQSDDSSCTLRNETPEPEKESQALTRPVELVEWAPSQKYMDTLAMYETRSDIETSSRNMKREARDRPVDNFGMSLQQQPIWGGLIETFSKKRKHSTVAQGTEEAEKIAETSDLKRKRLPHLSPQLEAIPETSSTSQTMTSRSTRIEVPSSDVDDMSSVSSFEYTPVKPKRGDESQTAPTRKVSLNQSRELPQLPEKNLTEILRARYSASTTPTRNIQAASRNSTSSTPTTNTPSTVGRFTASKSTLTPDSLPNDERFEASFRSAFGEWMDEHGKGIVEAVVKEAVEKQMKRGVKKAARKVVENTGVKERTKRSREREWSVEVAVDTEEEETEVEDSQEYIDDDEL